jgi:hypothetical protein
MKPNFTQALAPQGQPKPEVTVKGRLLVGYGAGGTGEYFLEDGALTVNGNAYVGAGGTTVLNTDGAVYQKGGTARVLGTLELGTNASDNGYWDVELEPSATASPVVQAHDMVVGAAGIGIFSQEGSSVSVEQDLTLGEAASGSGTYHLRPHTAPNGTKMPGVLFVGRDEVIGGDGVGAFEHEQGIHSVNGFLTLGGTANARGTYTLTGAPNATASPPTLVTAAQIIVGGSGEGVFTQNGGQVSITPGGLIIPKVVLGGERGGSGTYTIQNFAQGPIASLITPELIVGNYGEGEFT